MNDIIILAMMLAGPRYGYELKREAGWVAGQGELHNNLVYPALRRFLGGAWVTRKAVPGDRGQTRQQYALTAEGRRHVLQLVRDFSESDAASESAFRLRVGLFEVLQPEERVSILQRREQYLAGRDERLAVLKDRMDLGRYGAEVVRQMRKQIELEQEWIHRLRRIARKENE